MAETARTTVYLEQESTYGVAPSDDLAIQFPLVSEDLKSNARYEASNIITGKNAVDSHLRTDAESGGTLRGEVLYDPSWVGLWAAVLCGASYGAEDVFNDASGWTLTKRTGANQHKIVPVTAGTFPVIPAYQFVMLSGATGAGSSDLNDIVLAVGTPTSSLLEFIGVDETVIVNGTYGSGKFLGGRETLSSNVKRSYTIEKQFADLTGYAKFERFLGMVASQAQIDVPQAGPITSSVTFLGKLPSRTNTAFDTDGATAVASNPVMLGGDQIKIMYGDPTAGAATQSAEGGWNRPLTDIQSLRLTLGCNPRLRKRVGLVGPYDFGLGDVTVSGEWTAVYETEDAFNKHLSDVATGLGITIKSGDQGYGFLMPEVKFTGAERLTPGRNQDVLARIQFEASLGTLGANEFVCQLQHFDGSF